MVVGHESGDRSCHAVKVWQEHNGDVIEVIEGGRASSANCDTKLVKDVNKARMSS